MRTILFSCVLAGLSAVTASAGKVPVLSVMAPDRPELPGSVVYLDVNLSDIPTNEFRVALSVSNPICLQPTFRDSLWVSAYAASRMTGKSLSGRCLQVHLPYAFHGTSASVAMTLGIAAALEGRTLPTDFAVTGEILPNGLVGPVQGMPSKISAAAEAGIRRVAIPTKPLTEKIGGKEIDPVEWGRGLGVEVVRVRTLAEVRAWMERKPYVESEIDERSALALPPAVSEELTRQTMSLLARLAKSGSTNAEEKVHAEMKAGRLFSARQLATLDLAQRMAGLRSPLPELVAGAADMGAGDWIATELFGLTEKLRQEGEQGAPGDMQAQGGHFVSWSKALQVQQAVALLGVLGQKSPKAEDLSVLSGLSYALADLFEQFAITSVSNVRGTSVDRTYQSLYPIDPPLLIWKLATMCLQGGILKMTRAHLAWSIASGSAEIARYGGKVELCEDRKADTLTVTYGCVVYLDEYVDGSRKAALAAIAAERARGGFPALAIDAFECGERSRLQGKDDLTARLTAFASYVRAYLLCGDLP